MTATQEAPTRNRKPLIDYSALSADDAPLPKTANSALQATPFVEWMKDSRARNVGKKFTVPSQDAAKQAVNLLRAAAGVVNCGVRIVPDKPKPDGSVTIHFAAKDKRQTLTPAQRAERKATADKKRAEKAAAKKAKAATASAKPAARK